MNTFPQQWSKGNYWSIETSSSLMLRCVNDSVWPRMAKNNWFQHDLWILDYIYNGSCEFASQNKKDWRLRQAGIAHFYPPRFSYGEKFTESCRMRSSYIGFTCNIPEIFEHLLQYEGFGRIADPKGKIGELLSKAALFASETNKPAYWRTMAVLCEIITLLLNTEKCLDGVFLAGEKETRNSEQSELVKVVDEFLQKNLHRRITLREITRAANVSLSTLTHKYTKEAGNSPLNIHMKMRINKSKHLLMMGDSVKSIALELGFSDIYHFSKTFKRLTGQAPSLFRQS